MPVLWQNFSSVRNVFVAKLKTLKEAKKTGTVAPIAAPLAGAPLAYTLNAKLIVPLIDPKVQARKQSASEFFNFILSLRHRTQKICTQLS